MAKASYHGKYTGMNLSYWEYNSWLAGTDFTIVGSGIVGLSCALEIRQRYPDARIVVLERGGLPQGASTKNAGFACFGSISELLSDCENQPVEEVMHLVERRWLGIQNLRTLLGDRQLDYQNHGGHEVFLENQQELYAQCMSQLDYINRKLKPVFGSSPFSITPNRFSFQKIKGQYITHLFEGQVDTGKMMRALLALAHKHGILVINGIDVREYSESQSGVSVVTNEFEFTTSRLLITTNGFAARLLNEKVIPARAQVLVTEPIANLGIEGPFHLDRGYYYFRNIHGRILIGGGRNLNFKAETTMEPGQTPLVQERLEALLEEVVLPGIPFRISCRWSGIMGLGETKAPIVKQLSDRVYCGVRLGGMGVAIGTLVGKDLAGMIS
jgi:glycine/D-amino acid oxidase-like deaminating enzyme